MKLVICLEGLQKKFLNKELFLTKVKVNKFLMLLSFLRKIIERLRNENEDMKKTQMRQSFNQYSENETKIWRQNILNQFNRVSSSCLRSHFVISLMFCPWRPLNLWCLPWLRMQWCCRILILAYHPHPLMHNIGASNASSSRRFIGKRFSCSG